MITINAAINGLIVLACSAFLAWRGYERGFVRTVQRFVSVLTGYLACYFLVASTSDFLEKYFPVHGLQGFLIAAVGLLLLVSALVNFLLSYWVSHLEQQDQEPAHIAGLLSGMFLGLLLGIVTVWLGGIAIDAIQLNRYGVTGLEGRMTDPVRKMAGNMVGSVVGSVVENKMGNENLVSDVTAQLVGDPLTTSQQLVQICKSEEIKTFFSDPSAQLLMQNNQVDDLTHNASFQQWIKTPQASDFLALLEPTVKPGVLAKEEKAAHLLTMLYQKGTRLKANPRYITLSHTPEFQQLLQNPSPLVIATNPVLKELAAIVFSDQSSLKYADVPVTPGSPDKQESQSVPKLDWEQVKPLDKDTISAAETAPEDAHVIYRWTDENGLKHFSQKKPEGNYQVEVIRSQ